MLLSAGRQARADAVLDEIADLDEKYAHARDRRNPGRELGVVGAIVKDGSVS